jgi:ATP-dependent exoDNAse (exonuclease V) alpha subunit
LTETHSTFDRRDVLRRLIDELPAAVPVDVIESLASRYLQRPEVVAVGWEERTGTSFSTIELMDLEQDLVWLIGEGVGAGRAVALPSALASAFDARPSVSPEQAHVVTEMCSSGHSVDVLVAAAGTGKTFSLDAAREAWQRSSYRVIGCALAASAAHELEAGAGIPSSTIAKLTLDLERERQWLDRRTVLVIDEAGMVGTRTLAPLLRVAVASGAKVVLVGDPRQLPEIKTGGVLASLERRHPILTLSENRRQQDTVERDALDQLRSGDVESAMRSLREHGHVVTAPNAEAVRDGMVGDWFRHRNDGRTSLMMARRNADVDDLNRRARRVVAAAGELSGEPVIVAGRPFQVGDQVVCTRNDYPNGVRNGTVGEITAIDHGATTVRICTEEGDRVLGRDYLAAGWVRHGYAVTVHKAQGRTCDHGLLLASDDLHREMGYVGLSRGRESNRMYVVSTEPADELERHGRHEERADPYDLVVESLHRSAAKELAIDHADPDLGADDDLDIGW